MEQLGVDNGYLLDDSQTSNRHTLVLKLNLGNRIPGQPTRSKLPEPLQDNHAKPDSTVVKNNALFKGRRPTLRLATDPLRDAPFVTYQQWNNYPRGTRTHKSAGFGV